MSTKWRSGRWLAPLFIVLIVLLTFSKILFQENYVLVKGPDLTGQAYPWFNVAAYWFQNHTLLLWDPYVFSGKPNMGEPQPGVFYPINWIFFSWNFENGHLPPEALETLIILNFCLMALFVYFLARSFGISTRGSIIAGIICSLGGISAQMNSWLNIQSSFIWLPLILLFYRKANLSVSRKGMYSYLLLASVCMGISFLAGVHHPPILAAIFLCMYAVFVKLSKQNSKTSISLAGGLIFVGIVAALVSAVQILPSAEWGMRAYRWAGEYGPFQGGEKIPHYVLENFEQLYLPDFLSMILPYASNTLNLYIGPFVILLAVTGAILSPKKEARFFLIAGILFLFFSLGRSSILHTWLYTFIPGMWFAREALYFLLPCLICIGLLAGFGLDALTDAGSASANASTARFISFAVKLIGFALAIFVTVSVVLVVDDYSLLQDDRITTIVRLILYLLLIGILLTFLYYRRISSSVFQILAVALIVADLGSQISSSIPFKNSGEEKNRGPADVFFNNRIAKKLQDLQYLELSRVEDLKGILPPNSGDAFLLQTTNGYATTLDQHYFDFRNSNWTQFGNPSALFNTRFFISPVMLNSLTPIASIDNVRIYENPRAVPRAFFTPRVRVFDEKEQLLQFMNSPLFNPNTTALFLKEDWSIISEAYKKALHIQKVDFDFKRLEYSKAEDVSVETEDQETRYIFSKPWGWSPGDVITGVFSIPSDLQISSSVNYFPENDCNLEMAIKNDKGTNNVSFALTSGSEEKLASTLVDLGRLSKGNYEFQLTIPEGCKSRIDSLEFLSDPGINDGNAKIISYKPHEIIVSTSTQNLALMVMSEISYPGWIAEIDKKRIPIYRADYALRAIMVERGTHTIKFSFKPASIISGFFISLVSLAGVSIFLWRQRHHWARIS